MKTNARTLSATEAERLARTVVVRTASKGLVEAHGLTWRSDALLAWENGQREMGRDPKVEVRVDELDLHVVYVDIQDGSAGPFCAQSRQPAFTKGLSLFELNRLKKAVKNQALADRLGRLEDSEAMRLRVEFHAQLGHGGDPVALKRLSDLQNEMARLRLAQANDGAAMPAAMVDSKKASKKPRKRRKDSTPADKAETPLPTPAAPVAPAVPEAVPGTASPKDSTSETPPTTTRKPGDLPKSKYPTIQLNRRSQ